MYSAYTTVFRTRQVRPDDSSPQNLPSLHNHISPSKYWVRIRVLACCLSPRVVDGPQLVGNEVLLRLQKKEGTRCGRKPTVRNHTKHGEHASGVKDLKHEVRHTCMLSRAARTGRAVIRRCQVLTVCFPHASTSMHPPQRTTTLPRPLHPPVGRPCSTPQAPPQNIGRRTPPTVV